MLLPGHINSVCRVLFAIVVCVLLAGIAHAQSTDVRFATPVHSTEVAGTISARDIGDARLTDHFYTFTGVPGDLLITVDTKNLNGDIDVFTAGELRPLLKITVYAETESSIAKNIYLRKRESLILRVEARSPNDDNGSYRLRFSGSFEAAAGGAAAESDRTTDADTAGGRRSSNVSSTGARIEAPPEVAVAAPTPAPTPEATPTPTTPVKPTTPRTARNRVPVTRRTPPKPAPKPTADTTGTATTESTAEADAAKKKQSANETAGETTATPAPTTTPTPAENKPPDRRQPAARNSTTRRTPPPKTMEPPTQPPPERGPRLVIELNDGRRIEHFMSLVRRVTVENDVVVVVGKNGKVERVPMADVLHMSIGP